MECADVEMEGDFKTISLEMRKFCHLEATETP